MIMCPTTYPSFWRKIDRTIGLKTPVRPFDLSNFKGKGQQLSSNPDFPALDGKHGIHVVEKDSTLKSKMKPAHRPPMVAETQNNRSRQTMRKFNQWSPRKRKE